MPDVPGPERVLSAISDAGYDGTELGPPGYLGARDNLRERLEKYGLALVGGYIPIRFSEPEHWDEDLAAMTGTLDLFAAAEGTEDLQGGVGEERKRRRRRACLRGAEPHRPARGRGPPCGCDRS